MLMIFLYMQVLKYPYGCHVSLNTIQVVQYTLMLVAKRLIVWRYTCG